MNSKTLLSLAALSASLVAPSAWASVDITFGVTSGTASLGGDSVSLGSVSGSSVSLTPNTTTVLTLPESAVTWNYTTTAGTGTYGSSIDRTISIAVAGATVLPEVPGITDDLKLNVLKVGGTDAQKLTLESSDPAFFTWTAGGVHYYLQVTADDLVLSHPNGGTGHVTGTESFDFLLTAVVPEPSTMVAGAMLAFPFVMPLGSRTLRIMRKKV